ncbi:DNA-binding transcriptional regulator, MerR family [Paenibacillus sp. UNC496MF]|uniref:MerR family transcriptional regulator n=1 Tax=Paenibacillus sp. UNC496MF TaxID=1502753 RepID=UPI0008F1B70D|nr:MerR family transcriptional regulator [Paenibacillus sp. UNC496MF]SFJ22113.1 DNA-binding transcriptional regulator, MerR family [Paenibacillus sp. UNC496MF]
METFKIDEVAKACGLTKRTIRYYEELGLIPPPERSEGGIRLYARKHIERLKQLINARDVLGFSLQELLEFVAVHENLDERKQTYRKTEEREEKLRQLRGIQATIDQQLGMIDQKLARMAEFRGEIEGLRARVSDGIVRLSNEKEL